MIAVFISMVISLSSCVTQYVPFKATGGYKSTQLSEDSYQVRISCNGFTTQDKTSQYVLRRCAEITLEQGRRYFIIIDNQNLSTIGQVQGKIYSFPSGQATCKTLNSKDQSPNALDAVIIIKETELAAKSRLSTKARDAFNSFNK